MKLIKLTKGYFAQVDDDNFDWLSKISWQAAIRGGRVYAAGRVKDGEGIVIRVYMHRLIMGVYDRKIDVDHRDLDGLNNLLENLRTSTRQQNTRNSGSRPNSSSKFKGVSWKKELKKWIVQITISGENKYLGLFESEEDAARQFNHASRIHFGEYSRYNDVNPMFPSVEWKPKVLTSKNTSGFRGVYLDSQSGKWHARVQDGSKVKYIGRFSDPEDAAKAYDHAASEIHGDKARLNFPLNNNLKMATPNDIRLIQTCGACPEQYDAFLGEKQVGYLRLRHGYFRVDYLECGGETIYEAYPEGDGIFDYDERDEYLLAAKEAIVGKLNSENPELLT